MNYSKWQLEPAFKGDGITKWWQLCCICSKQIDFIKDSISSWKRVGGIDGKMVRHTRCYFAPMK
jgi:hypothetical protein